MNQITKKNYKNNNAEDGIKIIVLNIIEWDKKEEL